MLEGVAASSVHAASAGNSASQVAKHVDRQNGIDTESVGALVKEARRVIIAARSALN